MEAGAFDNFEDDYIQQTQLYDNQDEQIDLAKPQAHTTQKKTPLGIINKPIQKQPPQQSKTAQQVQQKRPVPPQFLNRKNQQQSQKQQQQKPTQRVIKQTQISKQKNKRQWLPSFKVTQITSLVELKQNQSATKRFKISFAYIDQRTQKTHNATLRFGKRNLSYVIDGQHDHSQALLKQAQIRKAADPFQPNYWCLWLLNNPQCQTLQDSLQYFRRENKIY